MKRTLLLVGLMLAACSRSSGKETNPPTNLQPNPVPAVEVVRVTAQRLNTVVRLQGELTPYEMVAIYPRVSAFVEEVYVDRGSKVRRGQLLVRLSAPELIAQRAEAEAKALADKSALDRLTKAAATPGAVARHDLEVAEGTVKADIARVQSLQTLEGYLLVRASFDGVITERNIHPGALAGPPTGSNSVPMLRIEQVDRLRLTAAVPEAYVGAVLEGAKADFSVLTWPGQRFSGTIRRISHTLDMRTRTMPVELDMDNRSGKLAAGMYAEISWPVRRDAPTLFVPSSAILQTTERTFVSRVNAGVIEQVPVQRGEGMGNRVEVFGPLREGELVVRQGTEELKSGTHVSTQMAKADPGTEK